MNYEYSPKELDALIDQIDKAVTSARADPNAASGSIAALLPIADAVLQHARSVRARLGHDADFLRKLIPAAGSSTVPAFANQLREPAAPVVRSASGKPIALGKCIGQGGEGRVYRIPSMPGKSAKIFAPNRLRQQDLEEKIRLLSRRHHVSHIGQTLVAAIPEELLYAHDGSFVGYVMPHVSSTVKIHDVLRDNRRKILFPDLDYRGMIAIAYNLAEVTDHMHKHGIVVGDLSYGNFLIRQDGTVALIDCDSFDITDETCGKHFPCTVGHVELLAPELQTVGSLRNGSFTKESDDFSLAIHIFHLLMNSWDPFSALETSLNSLSCNHIHADNNAIVNGECVFVRDVPGKQRPPMAPPLQILTDELQALFRRAFCYTAASAQENIANRPTAGEWMLALQHFYKMSMVRCRNDPSHCYLPSQTTCPFCGG